MPRLAPDAFVELFGRLRASAILRTDVEAAAAPAMEAAIAAGFRIVELPVVVEEQRDSKSRIWKRVPRTIRGIWRIRAAL